MFGVGTPPHALPVRALQVRRNAFYCMTGGCIALDVSLEYQHSPGSRYGRHI